MLDKHNDNCGCDYCLHLPEYKYLKLRAHHINKAITEDYYLNLHNIIPNQEDLIYIKHKIRELKTKKDQLKQI